MHYPVSGSSVLYGITRMHRKYRNDFKEIRLYILLQLDGFIGSDMFVDPPRG